MRIASGTGGSGGGESVSYFLRVTWDSAADQGYVHNQVLDTAGEGVEAGQLTVVENDGSLAVVSNELSITGQTTPNNVDLGLYSQPLPRDLGLGTFATMKSANLSGYTTLMLKSGNTVDPTATGGDRYTVAMSSNFNVAREAASAVSTPYVPVIDTPYQVAIVWGGYNSAGDYYYSGLDKGSYHWGVNVFIKGGSLATWTLAYRLDSGDDDNTFWRAVIAKYDQNAIVDNFMVPNVDLSSILDPSNYTFSLFNGTNGTGLDAYTPDAGNSWVEQSGNWEIQSNAAKTAATSGAGIATVDVGVSEYIVEASVTIPASGTTASGFIVRYVDSNNHWKIVINRTVGRIALQEVLAGVVTSVSSINQSWTAGQTYQIRFMIQGAIWYEVWIDGASKGTYSASKTLGENSTLIGLYDDGNANMTFNDIAVFPATDSSYDDRLDLTTTTPRFPLIDDLSDDFADGVIGIQWNRKISSSCTLVEQNGRLEFSAPNHTLAYTWDKYRLSGDFDVQVDYQRDSASGWLSLRLQTPQGVGEAAEEEARVIFRDAAGVVGFEVRHNASPGPGSLDGSGTYSTIGGSSGKMRITRSGTTVEGFYWNGSSWTSIATGTVDADDMGIALWMTQSAIGYFDNLVVNSGTVVRATS